MRKIIHIDMDAFYASVEQRDFPELRGKPVAVGYDGPRGVLTTASYEARKFGVRSAMATGMAKRSCPSLIIVPPRFEVYTEISKQIREIFREYTDLVEPLSLDEAYLDVTENRKSIPSATHIAREIKSRIREATELTASAGISFNKFLAKVASDMNKPDGLYVIPPEKAVGFVEDLPIEKFFGIGRVTAQKMHELGIRNGRDLKKLPEEELVRRFGKNGKYFYRIARAEDDREVNPDRIMKSLGAENTFPKDLTTTESIEEALEDILGILVHRMNKNGTWGKTITLKVKYADFQQITRSKTVHEWIRDSETIKELYIDLLRSIEIRNGIRLLGLTLSNLNNEGHEQHETGHGNQLSLEL